MACGKRGFRVFCCQLVLGESGGVIVVAADVDGDAIAVLVNGGVVARRYHRKTVGVDNTAVDGSKSYDALVEGDNLGAPAAFDCGLATRENGAFAAGIDSASARSHDRALTSAHLVQRFRCDVGVTASANGGSTLALNAAVLVRVPRPRHCQHINVNARNRGW
jgi:hypothetical protein